MQYDVIDSPIGRLTLSAKNNLIAGLHIEGDRYFTRIPYDWVRNATHPLFQQAGKELSEYFAGKRSRFTVPFDLSGTSFQQAVWSALQNIPAGTTITYSEIARQIGRPAAVRAVGTAIGRNPICIIVPCHRVVASDGGLGGFVAGIERKQRLLQLENGL